MNSLWERLSVCKEKIKELEAKLDSVTKEIQQLNVKYASCSNVKLEIFWSTFPQMEIRSSPKRNSNLTEKPLEDVSVFSLSKAGVFTMGNSYGDV